MQFYKEKFIKLRKESRWSITALANAAGISRQSVFCWESGKKKPSEKVIRQIADVMKVKVSEITDLMDFHPVSEEKLPETAINSFSNEKLVNTQIKSILSTLIEVDSTLKRTTAALDIILAYSINIIFIKDINQEYVLCNSAFKKTLGLHDNFIVKAKKDSDFFSVKDAFLNTKQDQQVLLTGKPILNVEQYIVGTRNKCWGAYSRIPIFDDDKKIKGVLCVIVDITERKEEEEYRKILEYAISKSKGFIWVGKGISTDADDDLFTFSKKFLYSGAVFSKAPELEEFMDGLEASKNSMNDFKKRWYSAIPQKYIDKFIEIKKNLSFPAFLKYSVITPITQKEIFISEEINFLRNNELFIGYISLNIDKYKLNVRNKILKNIPDLIVWEGHYSEKEQIYKYDFISNTESITGYAESYFTEEGHNFFDLAIENDFKNKFIKTFNNNTFPFSINFKIKAKDWRELQVTGYYYKQEEKLSSTPVYYGFYVPQSL